jgi:hypothetical protein
MTLKTLSAVSVGVAVGLGVGAWLMTHGKADEAWAIQTLRTINGAQVAYFDRCDGYAPTLIELITGGDLPLSDVSAAGTITASGYRIAMVPAASAAPVSNGADGCYESVTDYFTHADPIGAGRYFAADSGGTIFEDTVRIQNPIPQTARPVP